MSEQKVKVFVPATVANVACGFDILGFAVSAPGDYLIAGKSSTPGVQIKSISGDNGKLPYSSDKNSAAVSALALINEVDPKFGMEIDLVKDMPLGSGLGSSAASSAAGAFAANHLLGNPFSKSELVRFAMLGEKVACGSAHADNVAPAILGGFVLIRSYEPLDIIEIPFPQDLYCSILNPDIEVRTEDARRILRKEVALKSAITQWGNIAGLIAGLMKNDTGLIGRSLQDVIVEPERALLIPGFNQIKDEAIKAGAIGCSISGSGPSIFALSCDQQSADKIAFAMLSACQAIGITARTYVSQINPDGAKLV